MIAYWLLNVYAGFTMSASFLLSFDSTFEA